MLNIFLRKSNNLLQNCIGHISALSTLHFISYLTVNASAMNRTLKPLFFTISRILFSYSIQTKSKCCYFKKTPNKPKPKQKGNTTNLLNHIKITAKYKSSSLNRVFS